MPLGLSKFAQVVSLNPYNLYGCIKSLIARKAADSNAPATWDHPRGESCLRLSAKTATRKTVADLPRCCQTVGDI
jgi:hypothetical protein